MAPLVRRTLSPRGCTPILRQRGRSRRKVSVISALIVSPRRRGVRAVFGFLPDANYDGEAILAFLKELARRVRGSLERVWDRRRAHHQGPVAAWLVGQRRVRAHLLPAYAPELNPVELIWGHAKTNPMANFTPVELPELLARTQHVVGEIAENQALLRSFIKHGVLPLRLK